MEFNYKESEIVYEVDGQVLARLLWEEEHKTYHILSTFVDPSLRGKGVAGKLMEAFMERIKNKDVEVVPVCSYAIAWFEKHPEYQEYLK